MALKAILDTNIFLNVINEEEPFFRDSTILDLIGQRGRL
jgi:predicted nucleic acid-binding protein